jgi:protease I
MASAGILRGRKITSVEAIRDDVVNAGARWEDREVVVDRNLVTSRVPDDLPAFVRACIEVLAAQDGGGKARPAAQSAPRVKSASKR